MDTNKEYIFEARITDCRFYNSDSYWGVYNFSTKENIPYTKKINTYSEFEKNESDLYFGTIAGNMQELSIGANYKIIAKESESKYGKQYTPINVYAIAPKSDEDQLIFLQTMLNDNVAKNLLKAYPNIVNEVISGDITNIDCSKVKGIGEKTWERVKNKIISNYIISDIIIMLKPLGVTYNMIKLLISSEPNASLLKEKIERNPYYLTSIRGLGFKKVDDFCLKLNPKFVNSRFRLHSFIKYYLTELGNSCGDTYVTRNTLLKEIRNNVPECEDIFDKYLESNNLLHISSNNYIGLKFYYDAEMYIYNKLKKKAESNAIFELDTKELSEAIEEAENKQGFKYTKEQLNVIKNTLDNNVSIITGKAGTGKSSIMRAIVKYYNLISKNVSACAFSAMASKRITEASGALAMTIHRTLKFQGEKFEYNEDNKIPCDVLILDEGSMVGGELFLNLVKAIGDNTKVIISGDHKQLPPIGFGNVFSDLIDVLDDKYVLKLTKPMRQALKSGILVDANKIRDNINPINEALESKLYHGELKDMCYMFRSDREKLTNIAIKTYTKMIEKENLDDVVVITPRRQGCNNSSDELNKVIQNIVIKNKEKSISYMNRKYYLGDKVMQMTNDAQKDVYNGYVGYITDIFPTKSIIDDKVTTVECCEITFNEKDFDGEKIVRVYKKNELKDISLAYVITTHKMQGAGVKTVICIIDNTHYTLLDNCMLYTMLTRSKQRCALLAEPSAFDKCIKTSHNNRKTYLSLLKKESD